MTGLFPCLHAPRQVDDVEPGIAEGRGGLVRPRADAAHGDDLRVAGQLVEPRAELAEGDVQGVGRVTGQPLVGLADVEEDGAGVEEVAGGRGVDLGRAGGLAHGAIVAVRPAGCEPGPPSGAHATAAPSGAQ